MVIRSRTSASSPITTNHDARLNEINSEVLRNADISPPSYDDVVVMQAQVPSPRVDPAATFGSDSKLAQDLRYYNENRSTPQQQQQQQPQSGGSAANANAISEKQREAYLDYPDDLSDADSLDSEDWENETVAGGIHTPGTTVNGDYDALHQQHVHPNISRSISEPVFPSEKHQQQHQRQQSILDRSVVLARIRERHGLPCSTHAWSRDDWKAAKAAYKAEKREAREAWRAERDSRRVAWKHGREELREGRRELRDQRKSLREERRALRRGACGH